MFTESQTDTYAAETSTVLFQGRPIQFTNYIPILTPEQRDKRKREIERVLYGVFKKYTAND